jgi:phospholipase C
VVWIWLENRSFDQVVGSPDMPYLNSLAQRCGLATNSHAVTHPSLPNYLAAVSGSTGGVTSDCGPAGCPQRRTTLFDQVDAAHLTWRTYAQGMPTPCSTHTSYPYAPKHNPAVYFPNLRESCLRNDLPMGSPASGPLRSALAAGAMPSFALVVPGLCDDGHDCPNTQPDSWLAAWLPRFLTSRQYLAGTMAVMITYDEGAGGSAGESCATSDAAGCRIATVVVSPTTHPGTRDATSVSHYSLLRTTEDALAIRTHLGAAARAAGLRTAFHL